MKLDPRVKMALAVMLTIVVFLPLSTCAIGIYALCSILITTLLASWKSTLKTLRSLIGFVSLIVLLSPLMERHGQDLIRFGSFVLLYKEGLLEALRLALRFTTISMAFSALLNSTSLNQMLMSLKAMKLSRYSCLIISLTLGFIPFIGQSFERINESQKLRLGDRRRPLTWLFACLVSALVMTLRNTNPRAMALESRGCMLEGPITALVKLEKTSKVLFQIAMVSALFIASYLGVRLI